METFADFKRNTLSRKDKSNKGSIDAPIQPLIEKINRNNDYCTTSSCSGRIVLWIEPESGKKNDVAFLFITHERTTFAEIKKALAQLPKNKVWFRFEPMILHVTCKTIEDANTLLDKARQFFKHSGIMTAKEKIVVEIRGSEFIEALIAKGKEMLVSSSYVRALIIEANRKLQANKMKIAKVTQLI